VSCNYQVRTEKLPEDKFVRLVLLDQEFPAEEEDLMQECINDVRSTPKEQLLERAFNEYLRLYKIDDPRITLATQIAA
jgi:hypothetical protein